jgi:3-oxoadipate enol-lactonase
VPITDLGGVPIHHETAGEGEPVVLLNGILMSTPAWALQSRPLSGRYRCVLHDFRGQLGSPVPDGPIRMEEHVDDLARLLDHLGIDDAHLVGTSYGGEVGMLFALAHLGRVRSLVVIGSVSHSEPPLRERVAAWARAARERPEALHDVTVPDNFSPGYLATHPDAVRQGRERLRAYPPGFFRSFAALVDAFLELDVTARLPRITAPTLVLCGGEDALKPPAYSRLIAEGIPGAEFLVVPGAGHAVVIEQPEPVNTAILGFLAKHARGT